MRPLFRGRPRDGLTPRTRVAGRTRPPAQGPDSPSRVAGGAPRDGKRGRKSARPDIYTSRTQHPPTLSSSYARLHACTIPDLS